MTTAVFTSPARAGTIHTDTTLSRVVRGVVGGEAAGAVFALLTIWFTTSVDLAGNAALLMISTVATGRDSIGGGSGSVAVGVGVHLVLSAAFGVVFSLFVPRMRTNGTLLLAGGAYGLVVYAVNFRLLSPALFPAFQQANQPFEVLVHLVYGGLLAVGFVSRGVRAGEPRFDWR